MVIHNGSVTIRHVGWTDAKGEVHRRRFTMLVMNGRQPVEIEGAMTPELLERAMAMIEGHRGTPPDMRPPIGWQDALRSWGADQ